MGPLSSRRRELTVHPADFSMDKRLPTPYTANLCIALLTATP